MNRHIIAEMINEPASKTEEQLLRSLEKKIALAESAGDYKAQVDFWKEQYQGLRKQCLRAINGNNSLERLSETLEESILNIY